MNTLDELLTFQREHGLCDVHLVNVRLTGFDVAHTDAERDAQEDLEDCWLHRYLRELSGPPVEPGRYRVQQHIIGGPEFIPVV